MKLSLRITKASVAIIGLGVVAVACGGQGDLAEDGWGEAEEGLSSIPGEELALESAVSGEELMSVDAVDDEDMLPLDDAELEVTDDDAPDLSADLGAEVFHGPESFVALPDDIEVQSGKCTKTGSFPQYGKGSQLVTTEWLNLRTGPSTKYHRVTVNRPGTGLVVLDATCGSAWAHVRDAHGHVGYSAVQWTRAKSPSNKPSGWAAIYSPARGKKLAAVSWKQHHGSSGHGMCLRGVRTSIDAALSPGFATGSPGAHQFGVYARSHRAWMAQHHLQVYAAGEANAPKPAQFPVGTIMVFSRGRCGMNPTWGHVEIVVNASTACSDHCRKRTDTKCAPDTVILPRK